MIKILIGIAVGVGGGYVYIRWQLFKEGVESGW